MYSAFVIMIEACYTVLSIAVGVSVGIVALVQGMNNSNKVID